MNPTWLEQPHLLPGDYLVQEGPSLAVLPSKPSLRCRSDLNINHRPSSTWCHSIFTRFSSHFTYKLHRNAFRTWNSARSSRWRPWSAAPSHRSGTGTSPPRSGTPPRGCPRPRRRRGGAFFGGCTAVMVGPCGMKPSEVRKVSMCRGPFPMSTPPN